MFDECYESLFQCTDLSRLDRYIKYCFCPLNMIACVILQKNSWSRKLVCLNTSNNILRFMNILWTDLNAPILYWMFQTVMIFNFHRIRMNKKNIIISFKFKVNRFFFTFIYLIKCSLIFRSLIKKIQAFKNVPMFYKCSESLYKSTNMSCLDQYITYCFCPVNVWLFMSCLFLS